MRFTRGLGFTVLSARTLRAVLAIAACGVLWAGLGSRAANAQTGEAAGTCHFDGSQPAVRLTGTVTDPTGATVLGATVTLRCGTFRKDTHTPADGSYVISAPAGTYVLEVQTPGFEPVLETIELRSGGPQQRDFALKLGRVESIVTVTAPGGYVATSSTSATKTDAPLIEIPQTVSVVTLSEMESRDVQTINEAVQFTGGVAVNTYGQETRYDWLYIRGFNQSAYGLFRDDSRWQGGNLSGQIDPYMLQEVDVIKGPSSVLFGQNTPGGLVNLVTKRPPAQASNELMVSFGSYDRKQVQGDFGGPLDRDGHWRYRLVGLYRDSNTQVNYVPDDRWLVSPGITWAPSADTTLTILGDYQHDNTGWSQFLPSQGVLTPNPNGPIPTDFFTGEPNYDFFKRDQWSFGTLFEHRFNQTWTLRNTFRRSKIESQGQTAFGGGLQEDLRTLNRFGFNYPFDLGLWTTDTNVSARATTGNVEHSFLFGVDYSHSNTKVKNGFAFAAPLDVYAPVYGSPVPPLFTYLDTEQPAWLLGVYAQDHLKIASKLVATLSGRNDWTSLTTHDHIAGTTTEQSPNKFSGRAGLTYLFPAGVAPYVSYSTSFLPTAGVNASGQAFEPTTSSQWEGGLKLQPKHSDSFFTASYFDVKEQNVQVPDPSNPVNTLQTGEIQSKGLELEGVGSVANGLSFHASYTYLDQKNTRTTDPTTLGKRPPLVPKQLFSVSADYSVTRGALSGLGLNFGVRYVGDSAGDATNTIEVPSYTLIDASLRYMWKGVELQVTANNLADKTYVAVCTSVSYCNYGSRRQVLGSIRYGWGAW
jgi:iron complex outermembrane receptor protein